MDMILSLLIGAAAGVGWGIYRLKPSDVTWKDALRRVGTLGGGPGPWRPPQ